MAMAGQLEVTPPELQFSGKSALIGVLSSTVRIVIACWRPCPAPFPKMPVCNAVKVGDYSKRQMRLNNLGSSPIAYKIKTTNPKEYFVRPNQGVVQPKERAIIQGESVFPRRTACW